MFCVGRRSLLRPKDSRAFVLHVLFCFGQPPARCPGARFGVALQGLVAPTFLPVGFVGAGTVRERRMIER
eukprot:2667246-Lingulodinium_polyedra.AAC.1